jgi:hypothetical protein
MRKLTQVFALLFLLSFCAKAQDKEMAINKVWDAIGGKSNFEKARYFQFTFAVERNGKGNPGRTHLWDKFTGDYRLESESADGKKSVVLFNVNTQKGKAFENGAQLPDSTASKLVTRAYASFINDTYWLLVPTKLQDPGVNIKLEPSEIVNNEDCFVLNLNFDKVGLTPGDQYWLYTSKNTGEVIRWKFLLQNQKNTSVFEWMPYQDLGQGVKLSTKKTNNESNTSIFFPLAKVLQSVDKNIFIKL